MAHVEIRHTGSNNVFVLTGLRHAVQIDRERAGRIGPRLQDSDRPVAPTAQLNRGASHTLPIWAEADQRHLWD